MTTITDFNADTLTIHTPLTQSEALSILCLIDKRDSNKLNKILSGVVAFAPTDSYYERLKQALILDEI